MLWLDQKYIGLVSSRLDRFRRINSKTYNFRCPICGDSIKNKYKARGFFFEKDNGGFLYHCHNCNITLDVEQFLKSIDTSLYNEYVLEKISSKDVSKREKTDVEIFADKMKTPKFIKDTALRSCKKISQLAYNHPAKLYVESRGIPARYHYKLFYAPKFKALVNSILPEKFENVKNDEPRLIIPFIDEDKNLFGFQGRSFDPNSKLRYITIMLDDRKAKIFNLDSCDRNKLHYILEGPIDSMFVDNSIAMAGGSIDWNYVNSNSVFVYDNEPRSKETCDKINKVIEKGHKVVIFPEFIKSKDINDMIMKEKVKDIAGILVNNISEGLQAKLIFKVWSRT